MKDLSFPLPKPLLRSVPLLLWGLWWNQKGREGIPPGALRVLSSHVKIVVVGGRKQFVFPVFS